MTPTSNSRGTTWLPEFSSKAVQPTSAIRYRGGPGSSPDMLGSNSHEFEHEGVFSAFACLGSIIWIIRRVAREPLPANLGTRVLAV